MRRAVFLVLPAASPGFFLFGFCFFLFVVCLLLVIKDVSFRVCVPLKIKGRGKQKTTTKKTSLWLISRHIAGAARLSPPASIHTSHFRPESTWVGRAAR